MIIKEDFPLSIFENVHPSDQDILFSSWIAVRNEWNLKNKLKPELDYFSLKIVAFLSIR